MRRYAIVSSAMMAHIRLAFCLVDSNKPSNSASQSIGIPRVPMRPVVAATWRHGEIGVNAAVKVLERGGSSMDAVVAGVRAVELDNNGQYFVGVGGLPNADGEMELDAAVMDHMRRYGAVMALKNICTPVEVARVVMERSPHNVFAGEGALQFALSHGFIKQPEVLTQKAREDWLQWRRGNDSTPRGHDTVGMLCLDAQGRLSVACSTSGWKFKHPGRVGDSPLVGSGLYCDGRFGAAVATGDGEEIMRTCLSFLVVEMMRAGKSPQEACVIGIQRMFELETCYSEGEAPPASDAMHSHLVVGVVAMDALGNVGAASTLSEGSTHRGASYFPVPFARLNSNDDSVRILRASVDGEGTQT